MKMHAVPLVGAVAVANLAIAGDREVSFDGSAASMRMVVSGNTCVGDDTLRFGRSVAGSPGTFRRGHDLHGHLAAVSVSNRALHLSTSTYRCGP
jgi:hypothetical protein